MVHRVLGRLLALALMMPLISASLPVTTDPAAGLRTKASLILDRSKALARIWPGYWPQEQAFILYDPAHGAVLVGAEGRPRAVTYRAGKLPEADTMFVYDYPAGTPNMMMITVGGDWPTAAEILFHEQFHDFQKDAFGKGDRVHGGEYVDLSTISDRAGFTAAAELERRVLADAILAKTATQRADLSLRYLALRRAREAASGDTIIGKERYFERSEGTAQYVGFTASALVLDGDAGSVADKLAEGLRRSLFANSKGSYSGNWFRTRAYDVGGAIALLLDQLGSPDWKARVEGGEPLDVVLENTLGAIGAIERERLATATRVRYGSQQVLIDMTAALAAAPKTLESTTDFMRLGSRYLIISISVPFDKLADGREFSSTKQMIPVGKSATAFLDVVDFQIKRPGINVRLQGRSIMTERMPAKPREPVTKIYTVALDGKLKLPKLDQLSLGTHILSTVDLSVAGLIVDIERPVIVTVAKDRITLATSVAS